MGRPSGSIERSSKPAIGRWRTRYGPLFEGQSTDSGQRRYIVKKHKGDPIVLVALLAQERISLGTLAAVQEYKAMGWQVDVTSRIGDLCLARNVCLTAAASASPDPDVVLCLDDDVRLSAKDAVRLVTAAYWLQEPVAAIYLLDPTGRAAFGRLPSWAAAKRPWFAGPGCLAIPGPELTRLAWESDAFAYQGQEVRELVWSEALHGAWVGEDLCLSARLGGVRVAPIVAQHYRLSTLTIDLQPGDEPDLTLVGLDALVAPRTPEVRT
jgi:hypothetical protein